MKRKLTLDELNQLEEMGYNTSSYKGELVDFPDAPLQSTALGAGGRAVLANALPATTGAAGFAGGMALAAPFAPATGGLSFLVPLAAGLVSGAGASAITKVAQNAVLPQSIEDKLALDAAEHPVATRVGAIGANLLIMRPSLSVTRDALKGAAQLPAASVAGSKALETLNPAYRAALANVGLGAGIFAATEGGHQLVNGEFNPTDLAVETLVGAALNKPTALGRTVMRLPAEHGPRMIDNEAALRASQAQGLPPQQDAQVKTFRESLATQRQFNDSAIEMANASIENQAKLNAEIEALKKSQAETQAALNEATAAALESANYSKELPATPKEREVVSLMGEQKLSTTPSEQLKTATGDLLQRKNISVEENRNIEDKGVMYPDRAERKIYVNPEKETVDTRAHEGLHYEITEIEKDAASGNTRAKSFLDGLYAKQKEALAEYNKHLAETGQPPVDSHEFATTEQGAEFLKQQLNLKREGPWRKWWGDTKALWNQRFGKNPSVEDLQRALNYRFVNRKGMGTVGEYGPLGRTGEKAGVTAVTGGQDERKSEDYSSKSKYNHEFWSNNFGDYKQGIINGQPWVLSNRNKGLFLKSNGTWYEKTLFAKNPDGTSATIESIIKHGKANIVDHPHVIEFLNRTTKQVTGTANPLEGYRKVNVVKPDGSREEVYFNDKYYDMGEMGKFASIAKMTPEGKLTHGATAKGETIEEIPGSERRSTEGRGIQRDDNRPFMLSAERVVRNTVRGTQSTEQILNTIRNKVPPSEWEMLKAAGIEKAFPAGKVNPADITEWLRSNEPRAEVHSYGMEGKVSEAKKEYDRMTHEWFDTLQPRQKQDYYDFSAVWDDDLSKLGNWRQVDIDKAVRYKELAFQTRNEPRDTSPRATHYYSTVSALPTEQPMPEWTTSKEGRNVQRVDVMLPQKITPEESARLERLGGNDSDAKANYWEQDGLHENLPNTLGWAMIQYKTGPKGEKIAVIVEAQSRWGQRLREHAKTMEKYFTKENPDGTSNIYYKHESGSEQLVHANLNKEDTALTLERMAESGVPSHPLLKDYNRLILKAAIEQARKEGATHIVVSDAETAMMTQRHDKDPSAVVLPTKENVDLAKSKLPEVQNLSKGDGFRMAVESLSKGEEFLAVMREAELQSEGFKLSYPITQEPGMRLNYDKVLPKMAEELTGQKGERVSLGEHKNAYPDTYSAGLVGNAASSRPMMEKGFRKDLIFKNADGTPKTDVGGLMFKLPAERTEPYSYFEKRSSAEGRGIQRDTVPPSENVDNSRKSFFRPLEATFDKVERISKSHAEAARRYEARRDRYTGVGNQALDALGKFNREDVNRVMEAHREAYRNDVEPVLTGKDDKAISNILSQYYGSIADVRRDLGIRINGREAGKNDYYVPDMMNAETLDLFINKPLSAETNLAKEAWVDHAFKESDGKIPVDKIRKDVNEYIEALNGKDNNYRSLEFGAIRRAAGFGLPESMRDKDAVNTLTRYSRRAAADLAFFQEIQSKPEIAGPLHIKNQYGEVYPGYDNDNLSQSPLIQNMMQWITGNVSGKLQKHPRVNAVVRLINNSLLGPATGLRDLVSVPMNALPYISRLNDIKAVWDGMMNLRKNASDSLAYAAKQPSIDRVQFDDVLNAPDRFTAVVGKAADVMRKIQGREALENLSRDITFSVGKELGRNNILAAQHGDKKAIAWLKKFGTLIDEDVTKLMGDDLEKALNQIGKNFTDRNQGTYGGRGLPLGAVDSTFAPFWSLQKWAIEKSNVIYNDVYKPFITGENRLPMLTYSLGSILTGAAIQKLNEELSGRKASDPNVKEALAKGDAASIAHELATLMQLGSYAGIVSDGLKTIADVGIRGKTPRNVVSFPTATAAAKTQESVTDFLEAIRQGENPWEVLKLFALDMAVNNVQTARLIANHTWKGEDVERSDKFRDYRIYGELEGKPAKDFTPTNPYLGIEERKFKRTGDIGEAVKMAPALVKKAVREAKNPVEAQRNLRSLKGNSYQTFPSPEEQPDEFVKYYNFLTETQGKEKADERLRDFFRQRAVNKVKSSVIP